jgi:tetratricopeptide (TPR) repeat protein
MKMGRLERARELIQSIGVPPAEKKRHRQEDEELKAGYLAILAHEYLQAGQRTRCLELLSEACRHLSRLRSLYQYHNHWHAMRSLRVVDVYLAAGRIERALEVAGNIKATLHPGIDQGEARYSPVRFKIIATINVGNELALKGERNRAGQVLVQAYGLAREIDHRYLKSQMLKDVALAFAGAGRYASPAGRLISEPEKLRPAPDPDRGLKVAKEVPHPVLKAVALRMIGARYLRSGKEDYALQILAEAQAVVEAIDEDSRDATAYGMGFREHTKRSEMLAMAEVFHGAGEEEMAFGILKELTKAETAREPDTERIWPLLDIARRYQAFDQRDAALDVLGEAGRIAIDARRSHNPKVACRIARAYMQFGEVEKGFGMIQPIVAKAQGGETFRSINLLRIAEWLGENRHYTKARLVARAIAHDGFRDHALKHLGVQLVQGSRYEEALEMTIEIRRPADAAEVVAAVAAAYSEPGHEMSDRARKKLQTIVKKWHEDGMNSGQTGRTGR